MKKSEHNEVMKYYYSAQLAEMEAMVDRYIRDLNALDAPNAQDAQPASRFQNATEMAQALEAMGNGGLIYQTEVAEQIPRMHRAIQSNLYRLALKILVALALETGAQVNKRNRHAVSGAKRIVEACRNEFV